MVAVGSRRFRESNEQPRRPTVLMVVLGIWQQLGGVRFLVMVREHQIPMPICGNETHDVIVRAAGGEDGGHRKESGAKRHEEQQLVNGDDEAEFANRVSRPPVAAAHYRSQPHPKKGLADEVVG